MNWETSLVRYTSVRLGANEIDFGGSYRASFSPPYNQLTITFETYPNHSLSYYEVRVTQESEGYDIGNGKLVYSASPVAASRAHTFSISISNETFSKGDGTYWVSFYAKSAIDGTWDVTHLLFSVTEAGSYYIQLSDGSLLGVGTDQEIPSSST